MARIDRQRLVTAGFPVILEVQTRFDDLDMQGHVNNAAAVVILQEARAGFNRTAGLADHLGELRTMVAALTVEYARELRHPAPIEVGTGVVALGRTSLTLAQVAWQEGEPRLFAEVVMVVAGRNGPAPIPEGLREAYGRLTIA